MKRQANKWEHRIQDEFPWDGGRQMSLGGGYIGAVTWLKITK